MDAPYTNETAAEFTAGPPSALPTDYGVFTIRSYTHRGVTHVSMALGDPKLSEAPLVRVHSECLTGDALGSHRCDCGDQLTAALAAISSAGTGMLVYLRGQEGRGIGLENKLQAYALQDNAGMDTVEANIALGLPDDARTYDAAAAILEYEGCSRIRLLSSNPAKSTALQAYGITVTERLHLQLPDRSENSAYLESKRRRMNHDVPNGRPNIAEGDELEVYRTIAGFDEVVAQLAQSEDGFIATRTGDAEFVSGRLDRRHLHQIRAMCGAVMVGAGTVIADDPQLTVRAVEGDNPVRVVLDPRGRIPVECGVLQDPGAPTLWLIGQDTEVSSEIGAHVQVVRLPQAAGASMDPHMIIAVIRDHVSGSILIEGGGQTVSEFLTAGALDRLFLTRAPVLLGDGVPGIRFFGPAVMSDALRPSFRRYSFGEDVCTEYVLSAAARHHSAQTPARLPGAAQ